MKDKINEYLDKINYLIENECIDKEFQRFKFSKAGERIMKREVLSELFQYYAPSQMDISELEKIIKDCKSKAKKYNDARLIITDEFHTKAIIVFYTETEQEMLDRLSADYDNLLKHIQYMKQQELDKYNELKLKYESNK